MRSPKVTQALSALSQPTRLDVFERLAAAGPEGLSAGDIAVAANVSPSALSAHLAILTRAGLLESSKVGRHVIYRTRPGSVDELVSFLRQLGATTDVPITSAGTTGHP